MNSLITVPQTLSNYVRVQRSRGVAPDLIRQELVAKNWQSDVIEAAMSEQVINAPVAAPLPAFRRNPIGNTKAFVMHLLHSDSFLAGVFRGGFAFIFLINGIIAWLHPNDFIRLLNTFPVATLIGHIDLMVKFTGLHDIILGLLILSGKWAKYVLAWAGVWLSLVTIIKLVSLF